MRSARPRALALSLVFSVSLLAPLLAGADDPDAGMVDLGDAGPADSPPEAPRTHGEVVFQVWESLFDVVLLRPLGAGATVGGFAFFVLSAPFVAASKGLPVTWDIFVLGPADYTFKRRLGEF